MAVVDRVLLKNGTTTRSSIMAAPKDFPAGFREDRRSVYWDNCIPQKDYSKTTKFALGPHMERLVQSKRLHPDYQPDLESPIRKIPLAALKATPTPRMQELSIPKRPHPHYQPDKPVISIIPQSALTVLPSERLCQLAAHKTYQPLPLKFARWEWEEWTDEEKDKTVEYKPISARVSDLALSKTVDDNYFPPRPVIWGVTKTAQSCIPAERVVKLARPKNKHLDKEDYDPHTYTVSRSALLAQPSPRINELSTPLPRKVTAKK